MITITCVAHGSQSPLRLSWESRSSPSAGGHLPMSGTLQGWELGGLHYFCTWHGAAPELLRQEQTRRCLTQLQLFYICCIPAACPGISSLHGGVSAGGQGREGRMGSRSWAGPTAMCVSARPYSLIAAIHTSTAVISRAQTQQGNCCSWDIDGISVIWTIKC